MNFTEDPSFYDVFKDVGFPASFIAIVSIRFFLAIVNLLFNGALIWITFHSKHLRSRCNALLAFDALCNLVGFLCNFVTFFVVLSAGFIPLRICFWLQLVPCFFIISLLNAMLTVGIDRLLSVLASIWINHQNPRIYVGILISCCCFYASYTICRVYPASLIESPEMPVTCLLNDLYQGLVAQELFRNCMIFTGLTILCYAIIWILIRWKKSSQTKAKNQLDYTKRIFKSLVVNVTFVSIGYFVNAGFLILLTNVPMTQVQVTYGAYVLGIFTSLASISNAPALYLFSTDYRKAFNKVLYGEKSKHSTLIAPSQAIHRSPPALAWTTNIKQPKI